MKKILLLDTSVATQNIGDEIINNSIEQYWPEMFRENYICRFPTHTPPYSFWQQLLFPSKIERLFHSDYKFLCGTNALYTNMLRPLPQWNIHLLNAHFFKDTILLGVGAGINSTKINLYTRLLYKTTLSKEYVHSTRDEYTKELLEKNGFKAVNTGCPTMWGFTPEFCKTIPNKKSKSVIFTLTGYQPDLSNDKKMIEILAQNYSGLNFWPQTPTDLEYLHSISNHKINIITPNLKAYDDFLDSNEVDYIGNRLHGGIRALQHAKRSLIISIDYRAENLSKQYSLPIMSRGSVAELLDMHINSEQKIMISGIDYQKIEDWKKQFTF